jgi:hypothetical protein
MLQGPTERQEAMSFEVTEFVNGGVIEVHVRGRLTKEAYDAFVPLTEKRIAEHGKVRMLVVLEDFHGWHLGALWEDLEFDLAHFNHIERLALVSESTWERGMAIFCPPFTTARIEYFDSSEIERARAWIQEGAVSAGA